MTDIEKRLDDLRDEADRERLRRRDCERWLEDVRQAIAPYRRGVRSNWDGSPCGLAAEVARTLAELKERVAPDCEKCQGEGWLWRHELPDPGESYSRGHEGVDDTRYTCPYCGGRGARFPDPD